MGRTLCKSLFKLQGSTSAIQNKSHTRFEGGRFAIKGKTLQPVPFMFIKLQTRYNYEVLGAFWFQLASFELRH